MSDSIKARPTVYKGTRMRSRLEAGFAAWLDENNFDWEYEPCAFAGEDGQYLPDFRLRNVSLSWLSEPVTAYVEVKPDSYSVTSIGESRCGCPPLRRRNLGGSDVITGGCTDDCKENQARKSREQAAIRSYAEIIATSEPDAAFIVMQQMEGCRLIAKTGHAEPTGPWWAPIPIDLVQRPEGQVGFAIRARSPWAGNYWAPSAKKALS